MKKPQYRPDAVMSPLAGQILDALYGTPARECTARLIGLRIGRSSQSVSLALRAMVRHGWVENVNGQRDDGAQCYEPTTWADQASQRVQ